MHTPGEAKPLPNHFQHSWKPPLASSLTGQDMLRFSTFAGLLRFVFVLLLNIVSLVSCNGLFLHTSWGHLVKKEQCNKGPTETVAWQTRTETAQSTDRLNLRLPDSRWHEGRGGRRCSKLLVQSKWDELMERKKGTSERPPKGLEIFLGTLYTHYFHQSSQQQG